MSKGAILSASFVRVRGERDRIYVHRSNGTEVSWVFPTYGDGLPHDLVHLVAESAFGLKNGFWGRVDAGVDPARINDEANRRGGADKYQGFGEDRDELILAEGLAAGPYFDEELSDEAVKNHIGELCERMMAKKNPNVTVEQVRRVREALAKLREKWRAIGAKGTLLLTFDQRDPARGFETIWANL